MISLIVTIGAIALLGIVIVVDEIRMDRDERRYERQRDARLRQLLGDIHKR